MAMNGAWLDELAADGASKSSVPAALADLMKDVLRFRKARNSMSAGKQVSADMETILATEHNEYSNKLEYYMDVFPQHIQACASSSCAGLTVADREEALGLEPMNESDAMLLRWGLRNRCLTEEPIGWPDCSLTLSTTLIHSLTDIIQKHICGSSPTPGDAQLVLSIGSGSGLFEAHLQCHWASLRPRPAFQIHGVEVRNADCVTPNRYLLFKNRSTVRGTWELSSRLSLARVLIFVYPRQADLVKRYMDEAALSTNSHILGVIWLGPKRDWHEEDCSPGGKQRQTTFRSCFEEAAGFGHLSIMDSETAGLTEYEMMAFVTRKDRSESPSN